MPMSPGRCNTSGPKSDPGAAAINSAAPLLRLKALILQPLVDQSRRATDPRFDSQGIDRAVPRAGATLHAGIEIDYFSPTIPQAKNQMRTDLTAATATDTETLII